MKRPIKGSDPRKKGGMNGLTFATLAGGRTVQLGRQRAISSVSTHFVSLWSDGE
jgi:hypothetical protein